MRTLTISPALILSAPFINVSPFTLGVWLRLAAYAAEQGNDGRIAGAAVWTDTQWLAACGVTAQDVRSAIPRRPTGPRKALA